jgi:hypothetical protein
VRHAARRIELRQRLAGSGAQSLRACATCTEAGAQGQRRVAGEVRDRQHLVAQRRHQQQVHLREDARHLQRHLAAQAVGLHEVDRRQEARLAEQVRPGVRHLRLQLVDAVVQRDLLERRRRFREQHRVQRLVRPVGQRHRHRRQPSFFSVPARRGRRRWPGFPASSGQVADLQAAHRRARVEIELRRHAGHVAGIDALDRAQHQHRILHLRVIGPSLSSDQHSVIAPVRGTRPIGRAQAGDAAAHGRADDLPPVSLPIENATRPAAVAAPGPALEPDAPSSGSHGFMVWPPNQMSFSASAPRLSLAISTAPAAFRRATTARRRRHAVAIEFGAPGGGDAFRVEQVLHAVGNAVQRSAVAAGGDLAVGLARLRQRVLGRQRDHARRRGRRRRDARQVDAGQALGGQRARLDPARQLRDRGIGDVLVARRQRAGVARLRTKRSRAGCGCGCGATGPAARPWPARARARAPACAGRCAAPSSRPATRASCPASAPPAIWRWAGVIATCISFSASAKVAGMTSGPSAGVAPKVGGCAGGGRVRHLADAETVVDGRRVKLDRAALFFIVVRHLQHRGRLARVHGRIAEIELCHLDSTETKKEAF